MTLCTTCSGIPTNFFDPVPADFFSPTDCQFRYPHLTPSWLRLSASNGCPMCKILACQLHDEHLSKKVKDRHRLTMKRAIIDPQQGFGLWMGNDDLSHNFFLQVPSNYGELTRYNFNGVTLLFAHANRKSTSKSAGRRGRRWRRTYEPLGQRLHGKPREV